MNMDTMNTAECCKATQVRVCWSAIITGALVGVGLGFLLNLFALAMGLSAYSSSTDGATVIAIGGLIGLLIGVIVSMAAAGFVAGFLGRFYHCYCHGGVIYGFVTWSLALILSALLIMPMKHYVTLYESNLNRSAVTAQLSTPNVDVTDNSKAKAKANAPEVTMEPKHLAWSGWIIFILFIIGAFSSCIGACFGMRCRNEKIHTDSTLHHH